MPSPLLIAEVVTEALQAGRQDSGRLLGDQLLMSIAVATALATTDGQGADLCKPFSPVARDGVLCALQQSGGRLGRTQKQLGPFGGWEWDTSFRCHFVVLQRWLNEIQKAGVAGGAGACGRASCLL